MCFGSSSPANANAAYVRAILNSTDADDLIDGCTNKRKVVDEGRCPRCEEVAYQISADALSFIVANCDKLQCQQSIEVHRRNSRSYVVDSGG